MVSIDNGQVRFYLGSNVDHKLYIVTRSCSGQGRVCPGVVSLQYYFLTVHSPIIVYLAIVYTTEAGG